MFVCLLKQNNEIMKLQETKKAYDSILRIVRKNKDLLKYDYQDLELMAKNHLFGLELNEVYGLELDPKRIDNIQYKEIKNNVYLTFIDGVNTRISWSDDGSQPNGEYLIKFSFSTGAYIFGDDYPTELFKKFFLELKSYKPNFIDSANQSIYFKLSNAKDIFNAYDCILKKYNELNKEDIKQRKIITMQKEIITMQKELDKLNNTK